MRKKIKREKVESRFAKVFLEVFSIAILRGLVMALNLARGNNKTAQGIFLAMSIVLQLLISFSILYSSYERKKTCDSLGDACEKVCLLTSFCEEKEHVVIKKNSFLQSLFIAEIFSQVVSGVGVTTVAFLYKAGKLELWVHALLMVFFFLLGTFSYLPSVTSRRESAEYSAIINLLLEESLAERNEASKRYEPSSEIMEGKATHSPDTHKKGALCSEGVV